jgi:hypothetical protein
MKYLLYNFLLVFIIIIFAYTNSLHNVEGFTPKIREMYRPYVRNSRIFGETMYNNYSSTISNLFRKFGIM